MIQNQQVKKLLEDFLASEPAFSGPVDLSVFLEDIRPGVQVDHEEVHAFIQRLRARITLDPQGTQAAQCIRFMLKMRWAFIKNSGIDYFHLPQNKINKICSRLAEIIADENEPIIQVLCPTLLERDYLAGSLKDLTEQEVDGQRRLFIDNSYFLMENETTLLSLSDWIGYQTDPSSPYFIHLYHHQGKPVPLTETQMEDLKTSSAFQLLEMNPFFEQIAYYQTLRRSKGTLYGCVLNLCEEIKLGGNSGLNPQASEAEKSQRERVAHPNADKAVTEFLKIWDELPDTETKKAILTLRAKAFDASSHAIYGHYANYAKYNPSVEEYFAVLRHRAGLTCTARELELCRQAPFLACVEVISEALEGILKSNPTPFESFTVPGASEIKIAPPHSQSFETIKQGILTQLNQNKENQLKKQSLSAVLRLMMHHEIYKKFLASVGEHADFTNLPLEFSDIIFILSYVSPEEAVQLIASMTTHDRNQFYIKLCDNGFHDLIPLTLQAGASIATPLIEGQADILSSAILNDWQNVIEALLTQDLSLLPLAWTDDNLNPLHLALEQGQIVLAKKILFNLKTHMEHAALVSLIGYGDEEGTSCLEMILNDYGLPELEMLVEVLGEDVLYLLNQDGDFALHIVSKKEDVIKMKRILEWTKDDLLEMNNGNEESLLHVIIQNNSLKSLDCLMEYVGRGAKWDKLVMLQNVDKDTPLLIAYRLGHLPAFNKMLSFIIRPEIYNTLFKQAIDQREPSFLLHLMNNDPQGKITQDNLNEALLLAKILDNNVLEEALLEKGAIFPAKKRKMGL